jgi:hypothetical protein
VERGDKKEGPAYTDAGFKDARDRWSGAPMNFEIIGEIADIETFAVGSSIREVPRLRRIYGSGRWRKRKGVAQVRLADGTVAKAEVHWYEAHGIGRKEMKIKRLLDDGP